MILPIGQLMMAEAAGPKRMGRVMSIVAVPAMLAPILGPTLGGLIVDNWSWRWIFFVNVPIGLAAVAAALRILPPGERGRTEPLDARGLALMATGLPLLTYGLAEIGATGRFSSPKVVFPCLGGLALFGAFVTTIASIPFALIGAHTSIGWLSTAMVVRGAGIGFAFMPAMAAAFASLERSELPHATPQLNVLQRVGGSIGTAVLAVVLQRELVGATSLADQAAAYGTAFWWTTGMTALAIIPCVVLLRAERAARLEKGEAATVDAETLAEAVAA